MCVVHLVVTNDVKNAVNNYFLSLLGQNYVLDTLLRSACCEVSISEVDSDNAILCTVSEVSSVECSLSKALYLIAPVTGGLIQEFELVGVLSVERSSTIFYSNSISNGPTASLETTYDSQNSLAASRSICYGNSVVKLFLLDIDRFLAVVPRIQSRITKVELDISFFTKYKVCTTVKCFPLVILSVIFFELVGPVFTPLCSRTEFVLRTLSSLETDLEYCTVFSSFKVIASCAQPLKPPEIAGVIKSSSLQSGETSDTL